jgi:hypothetical protein
MEQTNDILRLLRSNMDKKWRADRKGELDKYIDSIDTLEKYDKLVEKFQKDTEKLFRGQFKKDKDGVLQITNEVILLQSGVFNGGYSSNKMFVDDKIKNITDKYSELKEKKDKKLSELTVHIELAQNKEEAEEILTRYGVLKDGQLNINDIEV